VRRQVPPGNHATLAGWTAAAQAHQAEVVRRHVETLRRLKYRPTGGFAAFALADPAPGATAALLDHERTPKPAWDALISACAPVIAVLDPLPEVVRPGDRIALELHVVNDRRTPAERLRTVVSAAWAGRPDQPFHRVGWEGSVDADSVERVGTVRITVPVPPPDGPTETGEPVDGRAVVVTVEVTSDGVVLRRHHEQRALRL
jgi:beta-mannosidase